MSRILDRLWLLLAAATDRQLTRMVEDLKAENRILRARLPDKIVVTPREKRRLLKFGAPLGAIRELIAIVHPRHLVDEYLAHYNAERPHQGCRQRPPR